MEYGQLGIIGGVGQVYYEQTLAPFSGHEVFLKRAAAPIIKGGRFDPCQDDRAGELLSGRFQRSEIVLRAELQHRIQLDPPGQQISKRRRPVAQLKPVVIAEGENPQALLQPKVDDAVYWEPACAERRMKAYCARQVQVILLRLRLSGQRRKSRRY